jgi:hypothetical protein
MRAASTRAANLPRAVSPSSKPAIGTLGRTVIDRRTRILCICGRPFSGKSTVAGLLGTRFGWRVIEADGVGREVTASSADAVLVDWDVDVLGCPSEYPYQNALRVEWERPDCFLRCLDAKLERHEGPVVLVGLRSARMLRALRRARPRRVQTLYVAAGLRTCASRYALRTHRCKSGYSNLIGFAVECDQERLRSAAQVVLPNSSSLPALEDRLLSRVLRDGRISRGPVERCSLCGVVAQVHFRTGSGKEPVCRACYEVRFNSEPCRVCGSLRPVHQRDEEGRPICKNCYQLFGNVRTCAHCGERRPVHSRSEQGEPLCRRCSKRLARLR